jgi:Ca2+-binding RTX toxin-like protein
VQTQNITTDFGDGTNVFSWVSVTDSLPEIFANGELVEYTLTVSPDGQVGTVTGTTSAGTVFSLVITLPAVDGQPAVATYTQFMSLQGEMVTSPGESMVSGGGNGDDLTLTFDAGGGETFSAVVTGENYVDGTATTINTNNKYIGAANNLMNPGEQVTMNFASGDIINAVASMQISFFNFDSESRVAPDELTIYGTTVDGSQFTLIVTNASLDASGKYTIVAPDNALIKELVFEAGIESSFKLGIESVSSVVYDPAFTLDLEYQLTDASGDSDTGTIALTLGGGDAVIGTAGDDTLLGTSFADIISGGAGDDTLTGGAGNDVFKWALADAGTTGAPAVDVITDFNTAANTDKLDLRDLLPDGLTTPTTLDNYLHFEYTGGNTIVHISTTGGFGDGNAVGVGSPGISVASETQQIVLSGVNLTTGGLTTDQQIIQNLITNQKLITD